MILLRYWLAAALASALALARPAAAQEIPAGSLTLQAAMDRALAANPTIAAARLRGAINVAGLAVADERLNPEATVEIEKETPKQAFGFAWPLELGGKRAKRIAVSEATIRAGEAELAATIAQVRNDVRRAYYDVLVADARLMVLRELRDLSQRARDTAQARFEAGDVPRLEVLQAGLALAAAENEATAAEGVSVAARARLNAVLGQPLETVQPLSTPIDAGGPVVMNAALDLARTGSTELAVLDRQIEEQRARLALAQALRVPDVDPDGHAHARRAAGVHVWMARRSGRHVADRSRATRRAWSVEQTTLDQLIAQRQATRRSDHRRRDGRRGDRRGAASGLCPLPRSSSFRRRSRSSSSRRTAYQLGQTGIAALLQALQASRDVRLRSLDAVSQFQTALADLERAIGAPLP